MHNGIIENYLDLRELLTEMGYEFSSETDSEALAHLIHFYYKGDLYAAVCRALEHVEGSYAVAVLAASSPYLVCARKDSPLVLGKGESCSLCGIRCSRASSLYQRRHPHEGRRDRSHLCGQG